ncbi:SIR2 family NAD-dependent protein deacylase [Edaphocola flava]|uniref:SIR2 family NAD-dependent protein deacylase n=1 Tax=Edaphocola flava TaxID=2499629 RepID=UPI00100C20EF|nr:NAD-dependent deacylase [Edaphocola flava]
MNKPKLVILSGAGISAESGLKTFRDGDGLWEDHRVEDVATPEAFARDPQLVLNFYNFRRKACAAAQPNAGHIGLAALEKDFEVTIITQNIDDLHERAGSTNVHHLHGEIFKMRSVGDEDTIYDIRTEIQLGDLAPDGHQLRPHIVWFGEAVPKIYEVMPIVQQADIFVVIGTSLLVYPAAGLVDLVPYGKPIFVLDKKLPAMKFSPYVQAIEKPASEGIQDLYKALAEFI